MIKAFKFIYFNCKLLFDYTFAKHKFYQEGTQKRFIGKVVDLFSWFLRERDFNIHYYALGLNLRGSHQKDYIGRREFLKLKNKAETLLKKRAKCLKYNYDVITKDKFYANAIFRSNGIASLVNTALVSSAGILFANGELAPISMLAGMKRDFLLKNIVLESGAGVLVCQFHDGNLQVNGRAMSIAELSEMIGSGKWVLQELYVSSKAIRRINDSALNTTRIVTILDGTEPVYLAGFQSFATRGRLTDGWDKDSLYVGIDVTNSCLRKWGYAHPMVGNLSRVEAHPDSGIRFDGYPMPDLKEAVDLCLRAHRILYFNFVVGWDVAITESGPLIVEANEKPGMNAVQCLEGGLRHEFRRYMQKIYD